MDVKMISIDTIGLSVRAINGLHRADVYVVGDMLRHSEESLQKIRNLGAKSIGEIIEKIKEYKKLDEDGGLSEEIKAADVFVIPENFEEWLEVPENQEKVIDWLEEKEVNIEKIELLSARAFNLLMLSGYDRVYQVAFLSVDELMKIPRMDSAAASEIEKLAAHFIRENQEAILTSLEEKASSVIEPKAISIYEMLSNSNYQDTILQYVKANDIEIEGLGLSNRPKNRLIDKGYRYLSDIICLTRSELRSIPSMGSASVDEIISRIKGYCEKNESRIKALIRGDESALWDDELIKQRILSLYSDIGFDGLSLNEMTARLQLPEIVTLERVKSNIEQLIAEKKLEYVGHRCYRVYGGFREYLNSCSDIDERSRTMISKRLMGETLEAIAQEYGLTRERVRQIVKKDVEKIKQYYFVQTGMTLFDEDHFQYLYETYSFEKQDGTKWLGIPAYVWNYLDLKDVKREKKDLQEALEDHHRLDAGLRLKIQTYLNRNKLYIDGIWIEKKRADLEQVAVRKFCKSDVPFEEFFQIYNSFLEQEEIPYDENLYYTDAVYKTRKNHLSDARFLLWKQNEQIRYYDIDGRDYTELLDTLNMDSFENIEFSTMKFMRDYPEIMERYDIRDQYELHNLLRKIVPEGSYHDFHCGRMPEIKFGVFDRDGAILDLLIDNAPISMNELAELISAEYGYDPVVVMANYLQNFSEYYHQGSYSIDQKQMTMANKEILKETLTEDFYYIDEIRKIYRNLIPGADTEEINPYNLKTMGFSVYSRYAVQNHASLDEFFHDLLTKEEIMDITAYKKRFAYVQVFSQKLMELKRNLQIIEFEPNQIISLKKLERSGVSRDMIQNFCDEVYDFLDEKVYFSARSLKIAGFESELYELGFSDWFYANLLISDDRFSFGMMFGSLILYKGRTNITIKSFLLELIRMYDSVDVYDLLNELTNKYGCRVSERTDLLYKIQDTEVYYDKILDRLYANKDLYYKEME